MQPAAWRANATESIPGGGGVGSGGETIELGFTDMFIYSVAFWERDNDPCGIGIGGVKFEDPDNDFVWKVDYKEALIGKCKDGTGKGDTRTVKLEPPARVELNEGRERASDHNPNVLRSVELWSNLELKHPEDRKLNDPPPLRWTV